MTVQFYEKLIYNGQKYKFYKHMNKNKWKLKEVLFLLFVCFQTNHLLPLFFIQFYPNF